MPMRLTIGLGPKMRVAVAALWADLSGIRGSRLGTAMVGDTTSLVDAEGTSLAVTVYNLSPGKGVIIGDSVAISEPFFSKVDVVYKEHQFKFPLIRVESPLVLVVNGKKGGKEMLAGVAMLLVLQTRACLLF